MGPFEVLNFKIHRVTTTSTVLVTNYSDQHDSEEDKFAINRTPEFSEGPFF